MIIYISLLNIITLIQKKKKQINKKEYYCTHKVRVMSLDVYYACIDNIYELDSSYT